MNCNMNCNGSTLIDIMDIIVDGSDIEAKHQMGTVDDGWNVQCTF